MKRINASTNSVTHDKDDLERRKAAINRDLRRGVKPKIKALLNMELEYIEAHLDALND